MRKILLIAALMMTTSMAHAGDSFSFMVNGQRVRIERPRNCTSLSCINIVAPGLSNSSSDDTGTASASSAPANAATAPAAQAPASAATVPAVSASAPAPSSAPAATAAPVGTIPPLPAQASTATTANVTTLPAPANTQADPSPAPSQVAVANPQPQLQTAPAATQQVAAVAPVAAAVATGPVGVWMTEKNEGKVHVINCGTNICGYAVDKKTGADGAQVLINMKPDGNAWRGRIHDTRGGGTYDSTVAMRGNDRMRVQGCAFGGMFCGGQTWSRVN